MAVEFYDLKERKKVSLDESKVTKKKYVRLTKTGKTQERHALRGKTADGRNLTKFVSKADWDALDVPVEND
ncbi:MAG: hypothetical protein VX589_13230 [Myxococcota bacterium]|nr:hypothetical protein [Myxococcota bacterium]